MEWKSKRMQRWADDNISYIRSTERKKFAWFPVACKESSSWVWLDWYWYLTYPSNLGGFRKKPIRPVRKEGE